MVEWENWLPTIWAPAAGWVPPPTPSSTAPSPADPPPSASAPASNYNSIERILGCRFGGAQREFMNVQMHTTISRINVSSCHATEGQSFFGWGGLVWGAPTTCLRKERDTCIEMKRGRSDGSRRRCVCTFRGIPPFLSPWHVGSSMVAQKVSCSWSSSNSNNNSNSNSIAMQLESHPLIAHSSLARVGRRIESQREPTGGANATPECPGLFGLAVQIVIRAVLIKFSKMPKEKIYWKDPQACRNCNSNCNSKSHSNNCYNFSFLVSIVCLFARNRLKLHMVAQLNVCGSE